MTVTYLLTLKNCSFTGEKISKGHSKACPLYKIFFQYEDLSNISVVLDAMGLVS